MDLINNSRGREVLYIAFDTFLDLGNALGVLKTHNLASLNPIFTKILSENLHPVPHQLAIFILNSENDGVTSFLSSLFSFSMFMQ